MYLEEEGSDDEFDIDFVYQLRHNCNLYGGEHVANVLRIPVWRIVAIYESNIHGSEDVNQFKKLTNKEFKELLKEFEDDEESYLESRLKNDNLIEDLEDKRVNFAGIGTNKTKRRLNKLAKNNDVAKAVRVSLEVEDKNILAKKYYGKYRDKIYKDKNKLILELSEVFKNNNWVYGILDSDLYNVPYVVYFEIPGCEQISWHINMDDVSSFPVYGGKWDEKENSTLGKLEVLVKRLLFDNGLLK